MSEIKIPVHIKKLFICPKCKDDIFNAFSLDGGGYFHICKEEVIL